MTVKTLFGEQNVLHDIEQSEICFVFISFSLVTVNAIFIYIKLIILIFLLMSTDT